MGRATSTASGATVGNFQNTCREIRTMTDIENHVTIDARVIALNRTHNYLIDEKHQPSIARIEEVYLYDKHQHTHCCELTPSYYLIHLYSRVIFTPEGDKLNDHEQDE